MSGQPVLSVRSAPEMFATALVQSGQTRVFLGAHHMVVVSHAQPMK